MSHPSWVCGLKLEIISNLYKIIKSHPSWVCGLKQNENVNVITPYSHTLRGCVD